MSRAGVRGGDRLVHFSRRLGLLDRVIRYPLGRGIEIDVPLYRPHGENLWDEIDLKSYERLVVDFLAHGVRRMGGPLTLIDCGADIGIISMRLSALCPEIGQVIAIEPGSLPFPFLERNLGRLPIPTLCLNAAAADFTGPGELASPEYDPSDHAKFLVPAEKGSVRATRIDDLDLLRPKGNLLLKIDVEGGELEVLRGARRTLERAASFVVVLEAHADVCARTGVDPMDSVRWLGKRRACRVVVCESPETRLDFRRPFFRQLRDRRVYNLAIESI